jgi:hypothetical protein
MTSSNRRVRGGEREREMGGGGRLGAVWRKGNGRESPPPPRRSGRQHRAKDVAGNGPRPSGTGDVREREKSRAARR